MGFGARHGIVRPIVGNAENGMPQSRHPDWEPITAYVADMSYFSGKMEAYLRYKEIPFERRVVDSKVMRDEILPATGLMKVPVLRLCRRASGSRTRHR